MKTLSFILLFIFLTTVANAQKIKFKDDKVIVDGKELLSYKKRKMWDEYTFYKLNTTDEIIFISYERNGTPTYQGDDYTKIFFSQFNIKIESKGLDFGLNSKPIIQILIQSKVLKLDGSIDEDKAKTLFGKYNEQIIK